MIFDFSKFIVEVDLDKTKKFYDESNVSPYDCSCRKCRNYMLAIDDFPKEVFDFFEKLCVDIRKSPEVYGIGDMGDGKFQYGGFYHLCGKIMSCPDSWINHEIPVMPMDFYSIADNYDIKFSNDVELLEDKFPLPAIQMDVFFTVPWKLD